MFGKKPEQEHKLMAAVQSAPNSTFSVLGADTAIKGDLSATADLHIDGKVEGDISCATLVQGESSEITGGIRAECARLSGLVRGSVTARDLVVLKTARLHGDIHYDTLTVEQGAVVDGNLSQRGERSEGKEDLDLTETHLTLASTSEAT
jgi:cytoskeletal protein CcmA (bactofilin family)